ncbi:cation:proton antiporter [Pseudonocardia halophobica]|uniref:cation:proton antiporter n=1 Tax=Pseudonocardia halophobica TaxID=29401 RepID=UPI003D8F6B66
MLGLEMAVVLGVALVVCGALARRYPIAPAILLVLVGVLIGFVPHLRQAQLPPEVVLLLFLPVLLYWESLTTSLREIRNNLRVVVLASTVLVLATAAAVAAVAHAIGLQWGPAWVLGAALAPTDATAVGVLARRLPRRTVTVLRAESLVNDGTALVIYGLAVGVTVGEEHLTPLHVSGLLVLAYGGGVLTGALTGLVSWQLRRRMDDPMLESIAMLVTPFAAFLLAELIHASGVLAVVVCGLFMSQVTPRITGAVTRQTSVPFWTVSTTVLSSVLFVLVGLQAQSAIRELSSVSLVRALVDVLLVTAVVIGVRWAWLYTTPYIIRALDRRPAQRLRRLGARQRSVSGVAGFRGAVSLAAVLAVPHTLGSGALPRPRPDRGDHVRGDRADAAAGAAAAACGAVRPASGRHLRRGGAALRRGLHHRRGDRLDRRHRGRAGHRRARGRAGARRDRETAESARGRRRRGRSDDPARRPVRQSLARAHRPSARGAPRAARRAADRRHRAAPGPGPARHRGGPVLQGQPGRLRLDATPDGASMRAWLAAELQVARPI